MTGHDVDLKDAPQWITIILLLIGSVCAAMVYFHKILASERADRQKADSAIYERIESARLQRESAVTALDTKVDREIRSITDKHDRLKDDALRRSDFMADITSVNHALARVGEQLSRIDREFAAHVSRLSSPGA